MDAGQEQESKGMVLADMDKNTLLHIAAASGNLESVLSEIEKNQKIDPENYMGWTPLMMAARNGHLKVVLVLIDKQADTTRRNKFGYSVFLMAVANGNLDIIHLLLQHLLCGGVSRQSMSNVLSPLSVAILFKNNHVLRYLVEKSFSVNSVTPITGLTPLMFAIAMSSAKAYGILMSQYPDVNIRSGNGETVEDLSRPKYKNTIPAPLMIMCPQQQFVQQPVNQMTRKSSNIATPNFYFSPFSPVTPVMHMPSQYFFPPEFSPNQLVSPIGSVIYQNDFMNMRANPGMFLSPSPAQMGYNSPNNYSLHLPSNERVLAWFGDLANRTPIV